MKPVLGYCLIVFSFDCLYHVLFCNFYESYSTFYISKVEIHAPVVDTLALQWGGLTNLTCGVELHFPSFIHH